jgi:hypothetical protein
MINLNGLIIFYYNYNYLYISTYYKYMYINLFRYEQMDNEGTYLVRDQAPQ